MSTYVADSASCVSKDGVVIVDLEVCRERLARLVQQDRQALRDHRV
jgi:hypothetical protein